MSAVLRIATSETRACQPGSQLRGRDRAGNSRQRKLIAEISESDSILQTTADYVVISLELEILWSMGSRSCLYEWLAEQTGDSRMVLKEELRLKIQLKRLQQGKPEMEVTFDEPRQYELSEEEKAKQERRKERNRVAAKNSRNKRKKHQQQVEHKHKELNNENTSLRTDVEKLRKTLRSLQKAALATRRVCSMRLCHN
ncbi:hypothetical protein C0Q70_01875 [Pomacea canaliculata]|uniref:BZIP domain-containing protein n=1 Tax=Pomacea canaliculata TaxID=400727 RepID=A0A2T7Q0S9_POMCA|nr:hypothetical protein C0Q70_01875 [Pomacea canaliculata]